MTDGPIEIYHPRAFSDHGVWDIGPLEFKVYGLLAKNKSVSAEMTTKAKHFIRNDVLGRVEKWATATTWALSSSTLRSGRFNLGTLVGTGVSALPT